MFGTPEQFVVSGLPHPLLGGGVWLMLHLPVEHDSEGLSQMDQLLLVVRQLLLLVHWS